MNIDSNDRHAKIAYNLSIIDAVLRDDQTFISTYPHLYRIIKRISKYLYNFLSYAAEKSVSEKEHEFFVSVRHLSKRFKHGKPGTWNRNINVFVTLGLIKRIPIHEAIILILDPRDDPNDENEDKKPVNVYRVPLYDDATLAAADDMAKRLIENNFRLSGFDKTFLIKAFGQKFADTVYPDDRAITEFSEYVTEQITNFILRDIEKKGYTTKKRILSGCRINTKKVKTQEYGFYRGDKKPILEREFNRSITQICDTYALKYRKANKELMNRFGLEKSITIIYREEPQQQLAGKQQHTTAGYALQAAESKI